MVAAHSHSNHPGHPQYSCTPSDLDLLRALSSTHTPVSASIPSTSAKSVTGKSRRAPVNVVTRRPQLDPLILETAASSGPHITRNHFLHEFYPHPEDPSSSFSLPRTSQGRTTRTSAYSSCDVGPDSEDEKLQQAHANAHAPVHAHSNEQHQGVEMSFGIDNPMYSSRQAPRSVRLEREQADLIAMHRISNELINTNTAAKSNTTTAAGEKDEQIADLTSERKRSGYSPVLLKTRPTNSRRRSSLIHPDPIELPKLLKASRPPSTSTYSSSKNGTHLSHQLSESILSPLQVTCHARTRVPTPHGEVFLHLYKNNHDDKEHLAFVFDRQQLEGRSKQGDPLEDDDEHIPYGDLRSRSLDSTWRRGETDTERIVRGAYMGRLSTSSAVPSTGISNSTPLNSLPEITEQSEKGEEEKEPVLIRIHSECFTGETIGSQRCDCGEQLDEAFRLIASSPSGLGVIIYLRQEGRGIGLLEKIKAYNLQDLGHDTVTANLLLGHNADMRTYGIAGEMLRDLGIGSVRLLTNNPDKIESVEKEGIKVVERVPMVPRGWGVSTFTSSSKQKKEEKEKRRRKAMVTKAKNKRNNSPTTVSYFPFIASPDSHLHTSTSYTKESSHNDTSSADEDDDEEEDDAKEAQEDYLIAMNRTGVGMIGAGTTQSAELDRYLRTKIERMGHLLVVPNPPPNTPTASTERRGKTSKSDNYEKRKLFAAATSGSTSDSHPRLDTSGNPTSSSLSPKEKRMQMMMTVPSDDEDSEKTGNGLEESVASLIQTDPESLNCGEDCVECAEAPYWEGELE